MPRGPMVASPDPRMHRMDGSELRGDVAVALADSSSILAAVSGLDSLKAGLAGTWSTRAEQSLGAGGGAPSRLGGASGWGSAERRAPPPRFGSNDSRVHAAWASINGGRAASDTESDVSLDDDDATLPLHGGAAALPAARHFDVLLPTPAGMLTSEQQRARAVMEAASAQRRARAARSPSPRPSARRTLAMTEEPRYPSPTRATPRRTVSFRQPLQSTAVDPLSPERPPRRGAGARSPPRPEAAAPGSGPGVSGAAGRWKLLEWQDLPTAAEPTEDEDGDDDDGALPQPWEEKVSRSSGETYYYNPQTNESTFERPGGLPQPWEERTSQSTGDKYYFNPQTGESTYDRPTGKAATTS